MKKYRIAAIVLSFAVIISMLLAGCQKKDDLLDPKNPVTLTLWHYYVGENQQALESAAAEFNQTLGMERGVIINAVAMGSISDVEAAVTNAAMGVINAEEMPDIFSSYADKAMELDKMEVLCDLSAYFSEEEVSQYVDGFIADGIFDDSRLLLIPVVKSTELTYINATAWGAYKSERGVDDDVFLYWDSIYETARDYYKWTDDMTPDTAWDGTALFGIDTLANYIIISMKQQGIDVIDGENMRADLDEDALRRTFEIYFKGMTLGYFGAVGKFRSDDIKSGDVISYSGSSSSAAYFPTWIELNNTQEPIDFLALPYPVFEDGEAYAIQQGAGMCVAKSTEQRETAAALFLKWFTAPERNIPFAMSTGYLPVRKDAYESETFDDILEELRGGEKVQNNIAAVYDITLHQIIEADTYAVKPFEGSYTTRSILGNTLSEIITAAVSDAAELKAQGLDESAVLSQLDIDSRFADWLTAIRAGLDEKGIDWE